ncbi:MAG: hypothetical protein V4864_14065 [Pseudomonadota bacterium]
MESQYLISAETFLKFVYPETRDLCKHFLTLVSGILVFSITFSEKIVEFHKADVWPRRLLLFAWSMLVSAFLAGGLSLTMLFVSASRAAGNHPGWGRLMELGGLTLFAAGGAFVLALLTLVACGVLAVLRRERDARKAPAEAA